MKRSELKRRTPLRAKKKITRTAPVRRGRSTTAHATRERAPDEWFAWVKSQPCFVQYLHMLSGWEHVLNDAGWRELVAAISRTVTRCVGGIEADHMGSKMRDGGDGEMAADRTCVGICHGHHMERHGFAGTFKEFCQEDMRSFLARGIAWTHERARAQGMEIPNV